ncbi:MAG: glycosyltransferase family A protein [Candidatus Dormibacteria bacterium]
MRYTIITPTLARETLLRTCKSIDEQLDEDWEHLIAVDVPLVVRLEARGVINRVPKDPRRKIFRCGASHKNYGNTCRFNMWQHATGDYVLYLDDDNYLADARALTRLRCVTGEWALFPLLRHGNLFYNDPPTQVDTANMLIKREHAQWPNLPGGLTPGQTISRGYMADWVLAERLMKAYQYQALPDLAPVVVMEKTNRGM